MIIIGTRGSKLALAQANWTSQTLKANGLDNEIRIIKTKGDVVQDRFDKMEGKGFFTGEIEAALMDGSIDVAVHSLKDLPTTSPEGLKLSAIPPRENPDDVLVSKTPFVFNDLGGLDLNNLNVGTSSNRRVRCIALENPTATFLPIRGNVPTRISKMERGDCDVLVLAQAGLNRLDLKPEHLHFHNARALIVPAPGQGALGIQTRDDFKTDLSFMHHPLTASCVDAERHVLNRLQGGCQLPLGVHISQTDSGFTLELFLQKDGQAPLRFSLEGADPAGLAQTASARIEAALTGD